MKKVILALVAILAVAGFVAYSHLGGAVKSIIERTGSEVLGTPVHVGGVNASLATRTASISGISVSNPSGFKGNFLETNSIATTLGGIEGKTVTIKEILIDGMTITYELGAGGTNFDVLKRNLKSAPASSPASSSAKTDGDSQGYTLIIQKLRIVNVKVIPSIGSMTKSVTLPEIIVSNIGSKSTPATPDQVAKQIMEHVLVVSAMATTKLGLSSLPAELNGKALNVDKAKSTLNGLLSR